MSRIQLYFTVILTLSGCWYTYMLLWIVFLLLRCQVQQQSVFLCVLRGDHNKNATLHHGYLQPYVLQYSYQCKDLSTVIYIPTAKHSCSFSTALNKHELHYVNSRGTWSGPSSETTEGRQSVRTYNESCVWILTLKYETLVTNSRLNVEPSTSCQLDQSLLSFSLLTCCTAAQTDSLTTSLAVKQVFEESICAQSFGLFHQNISVDIIETNSSASPQSRHGRNRFFFFTCSVVVFVFRQDCSSCLKKSSSFSPWRSQVARAQPHRPMPSINATHLLQALGKSQGNQLPEEPVASKVNHTHTHTRPVLELGVLEIESNTTGPVLVPGLWAAHNISCELFDIVWYSQNVKKKKKNHTSSSSQSWSQIQYLLHYHWWFIVVSLMHQHRPPPFYGA